MHRPFYIVIVTAFVALMPAVVYAQTATEQAQIDRRWNREWRRFTGYFIAFEGKYICFPAYERGRLSSSEIDPEQVIRDSAYELSYDTVSGQSRTITIAKPLEEAQALTLPVREPVVGAFGYIHSGQIAQITGEESMVLETIWLCDAEQVFEQRREYTISTMRQAFQLLPPKERDRAGNLVENLRIALRDAAHFQYEHRFELRQLNREPAFSRTPWRIVGIDTQGLTENIRWPEREDGGLHLAIVRVDDQGITAVPADRLGQDLSELAFLTAIEQHGVTKAEFVDMVDHAKRQDQENYIVAVIRLIKARGDEVAEQLDEQAE